MVAIGNLDGYSWDEREKIREIYGSLKPEELGKNNPYMIDLKFSPIEYQMWWSIKMYWETRYFRPEFPIGKYFADFADHIHKIVIECDGKEFHSDLENDKIRQSEIERMGWVVLRFDAKQILSNIHDGKLLDMLESGKIDECEYKQLIRKHKHDCIDCYFLSDEFNELLNNRNGKI